MQSSPQVSSYSKLQRLTIGISMVAMLGLTGCQTTQRLVNKFDNGSLNYQQAEQLDPIELPVDQDTAPFTPLYPIAHAPENTVNIVNESGNRYELPAPFRSATVPTLDK